MKAIWHFLAGLILGLVIGAFLVGWLSVKETQAQWDKVVIRQGRR